MKENQRREKATKTATTVKQKQETKIAGNTYMPPKLQQKKRPRITEQTSIPVRFEDPETSFVPPAFTEDTCSHCGHCWTEGEQWVECRSCLLCYHLTCVTDEEEDISEHDFVCPSCSRL